MNLHVGLGFEQINGIDGDIQQFGDFQFCPDAFGTAGDGRNDADTQILSELTHGFFIGQFRNPYSQFFCHILFCFGNFLFKNSPIPISA